MRILFVAFPESIHTVRWISQLGDEGWDIHLFPSRSGPLHPGLRNITIYGLSQFRPQNLDPSVRWRQLWPRRGLSRLNLIMSRFDPNRSDRAVWLARVIRDLDPDVVHSLEFQTAGYLTLAARARFAKNEFPIWAISNWGSDVYLYGRLADHAEMIRNVLAGCDYYHCECQRDIELGRSFGFKGQVLPLCPATGGFDIEWMRQFRSPKNTSARRVIALKGYQNWAGRALVGVRAIELCADLLKDYSVTIYMAHPDVALAARLISSATGIPIETENHDWTREGILRMHGKARISLGLSISDAISTSLLEAMIMGSFPIQSNTGCGDEWITCGDNGLLVPPESPEAVAEALRRALTDDSLVDQAAETNARLTAQRIDVSVIKPKVVEIYQQMAARAQFASRPSWS